MATKTDEFTILSFYRDEKDAIYIKYRLNEVIHDDECDLFFKMDLDENASVVGRYALQKPRKIKEWQDENILTLKGENQKIMEKIKFNLLVKDVKKKDGSTFKGYVGFIGANKTYNVKFKKGLQVDTTNGTYYIEVDADALNYVEDKYPSVWINKQYKVIKYHQPKVSEEQAVKQLVDKAEELPY